MAAWAKMAVAVVVLVMPGGFLFLLGWAVARAYAAHLRSAQAGSKWGWVSAVWALRIRDVWREARHVTGLSQAFLPHFGSSARS